MFALQWDAEEEKKVLYDEGVEYGEKKGREEGENRLAELMMALFADGRAQDAQRAAKDPAFRKTLFHEFHLDEK